MKKKLAILINSLSGGGAERVVSILLKELQRKYDITLILMMDKITYDIPDNIEVIYLEKIVAEEINLIKIIKIPYLSWKYKKICNHRGVDISLSFMYRPNFINTFAKILGLKSKVVISERNTASMTYNGNSIGSIVGRFLVKKLYPKANMIIPNSKGSAFDLIKSFNIPANKIEVINNPIDVDKINQLANEPLDTGLKTNKFVFILVGRLEKHKRQELVIRAFSKLSFTECELWILGEGLKNSELQELIKRLGLENYVKMLGFDKNPYKYMNKADCFILSSTREGFPNVLIEALACGLPVISTDCDSGPREILSPRSDLSIKLHNSLEIAEYGILTPVNDEDKIIDAMNILLERNTIYEDYKSKSKVRSKDFNLKKTIHLFERVL
ncbi:glycosyltransferase [Arcobacter sp.]|uniref:glycosyltransferase n=1 Tax=Arcobacter sp. TaxID=1872629 RepID=UPI003D12F808